jgi:integrase/recombinase XerC/integrase/recombinase XerD
MELILALPALAPDLNTLVADWLHLDVANGDACADTLKTYQGHFAAWLTWCEARNIHPACVTTEEVKAWRQEIIGSLKPSTVALKLTTVRRFYQSAVDRGLLDTNPVATVRPPRERRAVKERIKYLSAGEAELLFRAVPDDGSLKALRDRAMIGLMALEGLRRVEIVRACVEDIEPQQDGLRLLIHGKGKERFIFPREDTAQVLRDYLVVRGAVDRDGQGEPLFGQVRKGGRTLSWLSRIGVNKVVDHYLIAAGLKRPGVSCHALRHTCGTLLYQATRDIRAVQETLGHGNIATSAAYAHIVERGKARYTREIPIKIN